MKTPKVLLLSAAVAAFALASFAAGPLLSPRAKDNQIKATTAAVDTQGNTANSARSTASGLLSPRAADNAVKRVGVAGTNNGSTPAALCAGHMAGSPKMIAECASHPGMSMPCCNGATAK